MADYQELSAALRTSVSELRGDVILTGLDPQTDEIQEDFVFQYYPESVSSSKASNIQRKEVPGGSLPIHQWISSGEHTISFTAIFTTDIDFLANGEARAIETYLRIKSAGLQRRNVDIRTALALLRQYMVPTYGSDAGIGVPSTFAPRKCRLFMPGTGIGVIGGVPGSAPVMPDSVIAVMTQCDITYQALFKTGMPRIVEVSLAFSQVPQLGGTVVFPQALQNAEMVGTEYGMRFSGAGSTPHFLPYKLTPRKKAGER
jgi:hypothetical protein